MRTFQSAYRDRQGRHRTTRTWYAEFRDHNRVVRRIAGFRDRKQTEALGRRFETLVSTRLAGEAPDAEMTRWLETIPDRVRRKLAEIGLIDSRRAAASKPLKDHLDDYEAALLARGNTEKHAKLTKARVKRIFDGCGFTFWSDIAAARVQRFLADLRQGENGIGAASFNHHLRAIKSFCAWMVKDRRASESPVVHLSALNERTDRRRQRRALSVDEIRKLLETTGSGPERSGMTGTERALVYRLAIESGLRANEIRSLEAGDFDLADTGEPTVTVKAAYSKRRRRDTLPLKQDLAIELQSHLATKLPGAFAFNLPVRAAEMLREDLTAAGIEDIDDAGRVIDFHSLRHTTGSLLAASGVHPKTAQSIMRHCSVTLTLDRYTHSFRGADRTAVASLPDLAAPPAGEQRATGTDDGAPVARNGDPVLARCLARKGTLDALPCNPLQAKPPAIPTTSAS